MVNKNKWGEIQACYLLTKKGKLSATHLQPDQHSPSGRSQIPGATPRQETHLESPHLNNTETPGPQDQTTILDYRQTLPTIAEQQTTNLQGNIEKGMDLWNRAMGMRFTIKYNKNSKIPVQTFTAHNKRTMVRYKSNSSPRPLHRKTKKCVYIKGSCPPKNIVWTSKPAYRTADRTAKATTSKVWLDLWRNKPRRCQWIPS